MLISTVCERCGEKFEAASFRARYCSPACRKGAYRDRKKAEAAAGSASPSEETHQEQSADQGYPIADATLAELRRRNLATSPTGLVAMGIARRLDHDMQAMTPQELSRLGLTHAELLARTLGSTTNGWGDGSDPGNELARKRQQRREQTNAAG